MIFNIKKTAVNQAIRWAWFFKIAKLLAILFFVFFITSLWQVVSQIKPVSINTSQILSGQLESARQIFNKTELKKPLCLAALFLIFSVIFFELNLFWKQALKKPRPKTNLKTALNEKETNLAEFLDFDAAKICLGSKTENSELLRRLICSKNPIVFFVFSRGQLNLKKLQNSAKRAANQLKEKGDAFSETMRSAALTAVENQRGDISASELLFALSKTSPVFESFLTESDFTSSDIANLVNWKNRLTQKRDRQKKWWLKENLSQRGSVARDWVSTYTLNLDRFSVDLRERIKKNAFREIVGHKEEVYLAERVLSREQLKNVLLVGQPGTGRFCIVEKIAQRAFSGLSGRGVNYKRILDLDLAQIVAQKEPETLLSQCFSEAIRAGNIILCIRDIHNFIAENFSLGALNISALLIKYLNAPGIQIIALTSFGDFHNIIEKNATLAGLFEKIEVQEISEAETLELLENFVAFFERKYKKFAGYRALKEILRLSGRYMPELPFPDKALRLFDEAMSFLALHTKNNILSPEHIKRIVSEKSQIPLENLGQKEKELLLALEDKIHERMIDQEEAVREVSNALRRARAEVNLKQGPIGGFLFLGPTGVGKTELSKTLSEIYFGSEQKMIRLDMSEFQTLEDIKRLIGTSQTPGVLTVNARENPFSLLLLDELEKAHKDVLNLFLQVLDEGFLTDGSGRKVDFRNNIIIATSNAGSALIQEKVNVKESPEKIKVELMDYLVKQSIFRPEFLNRFDAIVFFNPLGKPELLKIAHLMLNKLSKNLLDKGIKFEITLPLKEKIVELSYNPQYGAREMKRVLQDKVENELAKAILAGKLKRGMNVQIHPENFELLTRPSFLKNIYA